MTDDEKAKAKAGLELLLTEAAQPDPPPPPPEPYITERGVHLMSPAIYHADPVVGGSLSRSEAMVLLPPSTPAHYKAAAGKDRRSDALDFGAIVHTQLLGIGPELVLVEAPDWRSKAAREAAKEARARGAIPMLPPTHARALAMVDALRSNRTAAALFDPDHGQPEQALFYRESRHGVMLRTLLDWLPNRRDGRLIIPEYKTADCAHPQTWARTHVAQYGYDMQASWQLDAAVELDLGDRHAAHVFVVQEKTPPYLVGFAQLNFDALVRGRGRNRLAVEVYAECLRSGNWYGYPEDAELVELPTWTQYEAG